MRRIDGLEVEKNWLHSEIHILASFSISSSARIYSVGKCLHPGWIPEEKKEVEARKQSYLLKKCRITGPNISPIGIRRENNRE
jgi:hypothetical protein